MIWAPWNLDLGKKIFSGIRDSGSCLNIWIWECNSGNPPNLNFPQFCISRGSADQIYFWVIFALSFSVSTQYDLFSLFLLLEKLNSTFSKCFSSQSVHSLKPLLRLLFDFSPVYPQLPHDQLCLFLWSIVYVNIRRYISHFPSLARWEHLDKEKGSWDSASVAGNRLPARILWKGWRKRNRYLQLNILQCWANGVV